MGHVRICGSRGRVTARGYPAPSGTLTSARPGGLHRGQGDAPDTRRGQRRTRAPA